MNDNHKPENYESYQINATSDPNSPTGVYIPTNLEEAITELDKMLPVSLKLKLLVDSFSWFYDFTLVDWLRNNWNLGDDSLLFKDVVDMEEDLHVTLLPNFLLKFYKNVSLLQSFSYDIDSLKNLDEVHIQIQERLKHLLNCDRATLWILDNSRQQLCTKFSISPNNIQEIRVPQSVGFVGKVVESRQTLNIPFDVYDHLDHKQKRNAYLEYRVCSLLAMPIFNADGKIIGAVLLTNKIKPGKFPPYNPQNWPEAPECWQNSFNDDDEALLEKLNQQIATLINRYLQ